MSVAAPTKGGRGHKLTPAEKAQREAARKAAADARQKKLDAMTDEQRKAYLRQERSETFKRLAAPRVNTALATIRRVGNLSAYPHSPDQAGAIVDALANAVRAVQQKFAGEVRKEAGFTLPE